MTDQRDLPYELMQEGDAKPVKSWTKGVPFEAEARAQLQRVARLPFVHRHVAVMPDVHAGKGATIGSVIPTRGAIIPAAVGVDIGCGMSAARTTLKAGDLPDELKGLRGAIERAVPVGAGAHDLAALPVAVAGAWSELKGRFDAVVAKHPVVAKSNNAVHIGTLGTGNHFIELCLDEEDRVWVMLHSGSRGVGNKIGSYFIERAKEEMRRWFIALPDADLAYLPEGSALFDDYVEAVHWAQDFAKVNRALMMRATLEALAATSVLPPFSVDEGAVSCHHNYVEKEHHFGADVWVTRKGAVRARRGELGIIPGSMGARSFIVRGKGEAESLCSCSHGAGRLMSRTEAKKRFSVEDHRLATAGVECRKDEGVIDETPGAYKPIDAVMRAQADLVEVVHTLRQVVCVKG
ncbi:MAG: RtcB family protein [Deltaproteobacteria bacterium]|nr:RtcB family protein [Deltaproteobacteria bacterium]